MTIDIKQTSNRKFDLEERTLNFSTRVRVFIQSLPGNPLLIEDKKQVIRSSGSVGANYIEANQSLGTKDFSMRLKISRKEAKESWYWLKVLKMSLPDQNQEEFDFLINEALELTKIFGSIINRFKDNSF